MLQRERFVVGNQRKSTWDSIMRCNYGSSYCPCCQKSKRLSTNNYMPQSSQFGSMLQHWVNFEPNWLTCHMTWGWYDKELEGGLAQTFLTQPVHPPSSSLCTNAPDSYNQEPSNNSYNIVKVLNSRTTEKFSERFQKLGSMM